MPRPSIHKRRDAASAAHSHHTHTHNHPRIPNHTANPTARTRSDGILASSHHSSLNNNNDYMSKTEISNDTHYDIYAGAEPGVNPRSGLAHAEYGHFRERCVIDIIEYDAEDVGYRRLSNEAFLAFLNGKDTRDSHGEDGGSDRGHLGKDEKSNGGGVPGDKQSLPGNTKVRWINIGGIDWEVLSLLAIRYNLHSLALEDILHERGHNHSKVDYYPGHIFIRILCNALCVNAQGEDIAPSSVQVASTEEGPYSQPPAATERPSASGADLEREGSRNGLLTHEEFPSSKEYLNGDRGKQNGKSRLQSTFHLRKSIHFPLKKRFGRLSGYRSKARERQLVKLRALTEGDRIEVVQEPVFIFMLRNGTVISIHPTPDLTYTSPISDRLIHLHDSVLRTSEDASLLVQSLLDLVVDRALEMVDEYQIKIYDLEHKILAGPNMHSVRSLHILSGDLIHHKRSLEPIKTLIYNLRRYDEERAMAVADQGHSVPPPTRPGSPTRDSDPSSEHQPPPEVGKGGARRQRRPPVVTRSSSGDLVGASDRGDVYARPMAPMGYFSPKAKVYLADVYDHIDFALSSLDMFEDISENLINFAFNTESYEMNVVMKRLTLVTIIFLPLTLLTGYFGMNFQPFWSVDNNSDLFFWKLAVPIMVALMPIFMFNDITNAYQKLRRQLNVRQALKTNETLQD